MRFYLQLFIVLSVTTSATAQSIPMDTLIPARVPTTAIFDRRAAIKNYRLSTAGMVVPTLMVSYGFLALKSPMLKSLNHSTRAELREDHPTFSTKVDNYLKSAPIVAVYGLNLAGIHGKHNFRDRTMLIGISALIMTGSVGALKSATHQLRPDGSTYNSFPSGHTSTAFMGAQFMWEEYKDVSPWYGVAGYAVATTTGVLRLYNNRHWVSDVVTGAGIGMLSTKAAYWLYPKIQRVFTPKSSMNAVILPTYNAEWKTAGISLMFMPN
jgi:membrane-associated phospholipid phosphatase